MEGGGWYFSLNVRSRSHTIREGISLIYGVECMW